MTDEQQLQRIEQENQFRKVYCSDCKWKGAPSCLHPSAASYEDTPLKRKVHRQKMVDKNADNDCPDFAREGFGDYLADFFVWCMSLDAMLCVLLMLAIFALLMGLFFS
jgi:hypothetical protein